MNFLKSICSLVLTSGMIIVVLFVIMALAIWSRYEFWLYEFCLVDSPLAKWGIFASIFGTAITLALALQVFLNASIAENGILFSIPPINLLTIPVLVK